MNPVTTALTLNMQLPNIAAVSWAVQGDQLSRQIQATLVDGSTAWNPQVGYHGVVRFHKPDGTSGVYDVDEDGNPAVTWTGNVATVKIVQQALTVAGTVLMQLEFYDANEARVTAFGWANNVQPSAVTDNEFLSSDYYNILTLQIAGVLGAAGHAPYIDSVTKDWMIWDTNANDYVDSGVYSIGPPPTPQSTTYEYANSASGTVVPSAWSGTRPAPVQGQYSWTKVTTTWETGTTVYYTVAYQGVDGTSAADIKEMIAPEEESATATNSYAIGDYFILNSTLYIATAAISPGDTITGGTNCQQAVVGSELVSLKNTLTQLDEGLVIHKTGDTADAFIAHGTFIHLTGNSSSSLPDGLYQVTASGGIGSGASYSTSNLTRQPAVGGSLNSLYDEFKLLENNETEAGTIVDLSTYNSSANRYTFPYDGYVVLDGDTSASGYIRVVIRSQSGRTSADTYMNVTGTYQVQSVFVKKGMRAYIQNNTASNAIIKYFPLNAKS